MVKVKNIGPEPFLCFGTDSVKCFPVRGIKQIKYRRKSYGSWVTITTVDGEQYFEEPSDNAEQLIDFLESSSLPAEAVDE